VRDIASVAVRSLIRNDDSIHSEKAYTITGPEPLSYREAAETLSEHIGRKISYVNISEDGARKLITDMGMNEWHTNILVDLLIYKPTDLWTPEDDLLFLKYCPNKRDKCYHAISRDLSCRPHEILKLKIKEIFFKSVDSYQYAEVLVNGKTGTRPIPLIDSIPYLKDYLDHEHPQASNPNAPLICGTGKSLGRHIHARSLCKIYSDYKNQLFPKLLESPNVIPEDKQKIELLKKPWNPYIIRHSALTEKSTILKEHVLRQHAGWSARSQMHLKYLHYFGNESSESLWMEVY
jgi:integrase